MEKNSGKAKRSFPLELFIVEAFLFLLKISYKILNCIIFTNVKLNLIGVVESPNCTFCQEAAESVEHLLFSCRISSEFWKHVLSWLRDNDVHVETINESTPNNQV